MNKSIWILFFAFLAISCGQTITGADINKIDKEISNSEVAQTIDSLIDNYVRNSNNELIEFALKDKISEEWLFDQTINTGTATYFIFQIGHDVADEDGNNQRFVTDQWIYIDSATKQLYEYDVANDSLIYWPK